MQAAKCHWGGVLDGGNGGDGGLEWESMEFVTGGWYAGKFAFILIFLMVIEKSCLT